MDILDKVMEKQGVDIEDMSSEEKETYDKWRSVFTGKITVEQISEFCLRQKSLIEGQFEDLDNSPEKTGKLILLHTVYSKIARMIEAEENERQALEKHLQGLLDKDTKSNV
jgi:hypothetical protein